MKWNISDITNPTVYNKQSKTLNKKLKNLGHFFDPWDGEGFRLKNIRTYLIITVIAIRDGSKSCAVVADIDEIITLNVKYRKLLLHWW